MSFAAQVTRLARNEVREIILSFWVRQIPREAEDFWSNDICHVMHTYYNLLYIYIYYILKIFSKESAFFWGEQQ